MQGVCAHAGERISTVEARIRWAQGRSSITNVYSIHTDDAVFSIGARLASMSDVKIVSPMAGVPTDSVGQAKHTTLRGEHEAACAVIGAKVVNGDWLDDVYPP